MVSVDVIVLLHNRISAEIVTDAGFADDIALLSDLITQAQELLRHLVDYRTTVLY